MICGSLCDMKDSKEVQDEKGMGGGFEKLWQKLMFLNNQVTVIYTL